MAPQPNYAVPTGEFLSEWMDDNAINAAELSRHLGTSRKHVSELLSGKAPLSHATAISLEDVTGISARIWNQYEAQYREDLARIDADAGYKKQYDEARRFPLAYLRRCGVITARPGDRAESVKQLLELLRTADLAAWHTTWAEGNVAYRRSAVGHHNAPDLAVWLTLGERFARDLRVSAFDRSRLESQLHVIRSMSVADPAAYVDGVVHALADAGVALVYVPEPPGLGTYGATRWVAGTPIIQLSLRQKTDDHYWFTLFHELCHVLHDDRRGLYLASERTDAETRADEYARDTLIPPDYTARLPTKRDTAAILALAADLGIAPGIVLGRVQHETRDYGWGNRLKKKLDFAPLRLAS